RTPRSSTRRPTSEAVNTTTRASTIGESGRFWQTWGIAATSRSNSKERTTPTRGYPRASRFCAKRSSRNEAVKSSLFALILAGGSGTRLWPRSRSAQPKQFIDLLGPSTMLQEAHARLLPIIPSERVVVVTSRDQVETVLAQLPDLPPENV